MLLDTLTVRQFRCLRDVQFRMSPSKTVWHGDNGTGKTSLLEGMSWVSWGKSLRSAHRIECIPYGSPEDTVSEVALRFDEGTELVFRAHARGRTVSKNGQRIGRYKDVVDMLRFICITDDEVAVIRGYPDARRSVMDYACILLDGQGEEILRRYRQIHAHKQALVHTGSADYDQLVLWHEQLVEAHYAVRDMRERVLCAISEEIAQIYTTDHICVRLVTAPEPDRRQLFKEELRRKRVLWGSHLDDMAVVHHGIKDKSSLSRGQQKLAMASCKIALMRLGMRMSPQACHILAFDDVRADLDPYKRQQVYHMLDTLSCQVVLTAPEMDAVLLDYVHAQNQNLVYQLNTP